MGELHVIPVRGIPEVGPGDDLSELLLDAIRGGGLDLRGGDIVAVTQKVVSKAEGRVVAEGSAGKAGWVARETRRVVARRGDLVIAETRHGFVCANAGVDASNVAEGFLSLLPEDPDASAERLRQSLEASTGASVGVLITDTFGRAWRDGLVNVAIGCAGIPSVIDLRGTKDALGRVLEVTVEALADEVAAAAGLAMGKADGVPAAIVRGIRVEEPPLPASALVRPPDDDLFRQSPLEAIRQQRAELEGPAPFGSGQVPRAVLEEAIRAACAGQAPDGNGACVFVVTRLPRVAPVVIVPFVRVQEGSDRDATMVRGGMALQSVMLALHAQGFHCHWIDGSAFEAAVDAALNVPDGWIPVGSIGVGRPPDPSDAGAQAIARAEDVDVSRFLREAP